MKIKKKKNSPSIKILGKTIDKKNFPKLYEWGKNNPETLENTLLSLQKATGGSLGMTMINLESDLEHG